MRRVSAIIAAAIVLLASCTKEEGEPDPRQYLSGTVQIGVNSDLPGWSDYTNGVWRGFDIELARWLGAEIGFRPQFTPVTTDERMIRLVEVSRSTADPGSRSNS
jgi:glutamate transport system substrate-binding protein